MSVPVLYIAHTASVHDLVCVREREGVSKREARVPGQGGRGVSSSETTMAIDHVYLGVGFEETGFDTYHGLRRGDRCRLSRGLLVCV